MTSLVQSSTPRWEAVEVGLTIAGTPKLLSATDMVLQISGSQDWNRVHYDTEYARQSGHPDIFFNTGWTNAILCKVLTDWVGAEGWLRRVEFQMRRMISPGDTVTGKGKVLAKRQDDDGSGLVELEVWLETDRLDVTTTGTALVVLPRAD